MLCFRATLTSAAEPQRSPTASPPEVVVNPNTTPPPQQAVVVFDVKKLATMSRPAVALITVLDKDGKLVKSGTGFFVSADGKLVTNAHVIEGAASASAKLENGATYSIRGVLRPAVDKDLLLLQADAKDVPYLTPSGQPMPDVGSRVALIGSPFGLEGPGHENKISHPRDLTQELASDVTRSGGVGCIAWLDDLGLSGAYNVWAGSNPSSPTHPVADAERHQRTQATTDSTGPGQFRFGSQVGARIGIC